MTTITWDNTPLKDARDLVTEQIVAATALDVYPEWKESLVSGDVVLQGKGWEVLTGTDCLYHLDVIVVYASNGDDSAEVVEELARRVWVSMNAAFAVAEMSELLEISQGERKFFGYRLKLDLKVDLGPVEVVDEEEGD